MIDIFLLLLLSYPFYFNWDEITSLLVYSIIKVIHFASKIEIKFPPHQPTLSVST